MLIIRTFFFPSSSLAHSIAASISAPQPRFTSENDMLRVRGLFAALICLGLVGAAAGQATKDAKPAIDADKIVGSWVVAKGEGVPPGTPVEFTKDGKVIVKFEANGKSITLDGTYKVAADKLTITMKTPDGKDKADTETIKALTAEKLVTVDDKGKETEFKRASEKKPATK
jgi:uncharacterized protein (TIGR03066 family)